MSDRLLMKLPDPLMVAKSHMVSYMRWLSLHGYVNVDDEEALHAWSIKESALFWESIWHWGQVVFSKPYCEIVSADEMPNTKWFEGARLNFAENLLQSCFTHPDREQVFAHHESGTTKAYTGRNLLDMVSKVTSFLKSANVQVGDRVAGIVCNDIEAMVAMLATTSLGAIWSSCSPDFGAQGVLDRFGQIEPKVLFVTDGYAYNEKIFLCVERIQEIVEKIASIKNVVWISRIGEPVSTFSRARVSLWSEIEQESPSRLHFEQLPFSHPVYILYSSGTTGVPKCIVHGAGGVLLQHKKELLLHSNIKEEDHFLYYTTTGWMMWNWMVSALMTGCAVHLYDGSPAVKGLEAFWRFLEREQITIFGTSAKFLSSCRMSKVLESQSDVFPQIHTILSTGSPLLPQDFEWVYEHINSNIILSSISGGTDIVSCFFLGSPMRPIYCGELQTMGLGMNVKSYSDHGMPLINEVGELVCVSPVPTMPVGFWNDSDRKKYHAAYFEKFPKVWSHGDFVKIYSDRSAVIYGRSDATLNPGGVRIGTAEIYRQVEHCEEIKDSLVVSQPWNDDERIVLFVVLREGFVLDEALLSKMKTKILEGASSRHVPAKILQIQEVPYTISGKKVEIAVAKMLRGKSVENESSLMNPISLTQFLNLSELEF